MDQLSRLPVIKEEELAGRVGVTLKELNKVTATLLNHRLIKVYRQNELKSERAQRAVPRSYYWIDYQDFCNVVKWRISGMRRAIDEKLKNELNNKGYICTQCQKTYTPLDVDRLFDPMRNAFVCDICQGELTDNENAENVRGGKDRMQRFNTQTSHIVDALRKVESISLPPLDVAEWVRKNAQAAAPDGTPVDDGLQIAGANGTGKAQATRVSVIIEDDKTDEALRREREKKADAKRQQNALPEWHLQSTVSGHLTTLGLKNEAQNAQYARAIPDPGQIDRKPFAQGEIDLEAYFSSLNKDETPEADTPPLSNGATASQSSLGKRERDMEDDLFPSSKMQKMEDVGEDDSTNPIVYVAGEAKRFRDITETEQELMTPEEYEAYAELTVALT
ncbi:Transcription initiation factor IIE subunit alpha OS=Schizosaccharomyces pombe (strain 972 / ATCC 24843) GN=tfa1 PE=1 SV=3 [Rhizoctonia solani AG-1 IB]|uniref:Transcription initiation factor IIE subunit alpha n=1 Tax=Thanatephorus cucumeris (strain AG1-IB / isolate 7/3/14) TaxID=1108050 RepID=A0A0B7FLX8_THACB|nr:Transcription initiation factor IIE subunit alpha OS=Schizosaccharomyces pombe (strain 972 / ATCC 24843) GN=tfa1 PE=1 SV=3 [Rhizoctonia solani AG-1 IB]